MAAKYGAVRIGVVDRMTKLVSGPNQMSKSNVSAGGMVGLFFSVVVLLASLYSLYIFLGTDRKAHRMGDDRVRKGHNHRDGRSYSSTVRSSTASQPSVRSDDEGRKYNHKLFVEFGPSFDMDRDRVVQELEEESSCLPEYVLQDPIYSDYLETLQRHDNGENLQVI
jgi:hypothetical protein